jgi:hypothetical protein
MKMQSLTLALVLILGAALIMFTVQSLAAPQAENLSPAVPSAPSAPSDWQLESVEIGAHVDSGTALALDPDTQYPRIAYGYGPTDDSRVLQYASYNGTAWLTETVSSSDGIKGNLSLAVDGAGNPHVSYYVYTGNLMHAWHDGASWHVETVDGSASVGQYTSLALDSSDLPRISYYGSGVGLKYARYDGAAWHIETVDSTGNVGQYTSLALDQSDRPHISYFDNDNGDLKYAWYNGTTWNIETVDSQGNVGWYSSLELDAAGRPHISYYGVGLKYARYDGASWRIETVDSGFDIGWYSSLALDGVGLPHISYYDLAQGDLKYAWYDSQTWHIETVDSGTELLAGWYTSMAVDEQGRARISYYEFSAKELKHARRLYAHIFLDKQASPSGHVRNGDTLTYTLTLFGPGLDIALADPLSDNVTYVSDSITYTVPTVVYSPTLHAVIWQGIMPTDTIQEVSFQVTVDVPGAAPSELAPTIYNTAVLTDTARDVSLSSTAVVNRFVYLPLVMRMQ